MDLGQPAVIEPNQDHTVHVATHLAKLSEINGQLSQFQIEFARAIELMGPIWRHAVEHMAYISPKNPLYKNFKEALSEIEEVVVNGEKKLAAEARRAEEQAGQQAAPGSDVPLGILRQSADAGARLEMLDVQAKRQQLGFEAEKQRLELAKKQQDLAFNDAKMANEIRKQTAG